MLGRAAAKTGRSRLRLRMPRRHPAPTAIMQTDMPASHGSLLSPSPLNVRRSNPKFFQLSTSSLAKKLPHHSTTHHSPLTKSQQKQRAGGFGASGPLHFQLLLHGSGRRLSPARKTNLTSGYSYNFVRTRLHLAACPDPAA
jgi:hypothetical protein